MKNKPSKTTRFQLGRTGLLTSILAFTLAVSAQSLQASGASRTNPGSSKPNPFAAAFLSAGKGGHYAWMNNRMMVRGDAEDHFSRTNPGSNRPGVSRPFYYPDFGGKEIHVSRLVDISSSDRGDHFAWYLDGNERLWVADIVFDRSKLALSNWQRSALPHGCDPDALLFVTSTQERHRAWFSKDGVMWSAWGSKLDFNAFGANRVRIAPGVPHRDLVYMAGKDGYLFGFNKDGRYFKGWASDLDAEHTGRYDYRELRRLPQSNAPKPTK